MTGLLELTRIVGYGGIGILIGYLLGVRERDRHYLAHHPEAARAMKSKTHRPSGRTVQTLVVVFVMVALLLTGLTSIQSNRDRAEDARQDRAASDQRCDDLRKVVAALEARSKVNSDTTDLNDDLWRGIRHIFLDFPGGNESPLLTQIDEYLDQRREQKAELADNPITTDILTGCDEP